MSALLFLLWAISAVSLVLAVFIVCCRPRWAHLEYDRELWRIAWTKTGEWIHDYRKTEGMVVIGTLVMAFLTAPGSAIGERLVYAVVNGVGALVIAVVGLFLLEYSRAPWITLEAAKAAPYEPDVAFGIVVEHNTVFLEVRNHLKTGLFAAQASLVDGLTTIPDRFYMAWKNSADERREIVKDGLQYVQLLRVYPESLTDGTTTFSKVVMFEVGVGERQVFPRSSKMHGREVQTFNPIRIRVHVSDPNDLTRTVRVYVYMFIFSNQATLRAVLERDY